MGEANYMLEVKILRDRSKGLLGLSQETCIKKILKWFEMQNCKSIDTLIVKGESLSLEIALKTPNEQKQMARVPYSSAISSLMYVMMCTRLDINFPVGLVSRFQSNLGLSHQKPLNKYYAISKELQIVYRGTNLNLVGYSDADQGVDLDKCKSTSGCDFFA